MQKQKNKQTKNKKIYSTNSLSNSKGKIFVFSAPSGAGKTTILSKLRSTFPQLCYSVSVTTRKPRKGEKNGVHYLFVDRDEFKSMISSNEFAEWALVHGEYYGTPKDFIDKSIAMGKHVIMDIDVVGKLKFDKNYPEAIGILILPPSLECLEKRLRKRATDTEEQITLRLRNAKREIEIAQTKGKYEYTVVNDNLRKATTEVIEIIRKYSSSDSTN